MQVSGVRKEVIKENVVVEIDFREALKSAYWNCLKDKPKDARYIKDGYWYVHDFYDYHKRLDQEKRDRKATDEEVALNEACKVFLQAATEHNL